MKVKPMLVRLVQPPEDIPILALRLEDYYRVTGWSKPTGLRHLKYIKSYYVKMPGLNRGTRLVDYKALQDYLAKFAEGQKV